MICCFSTQVFKEASRCTLLTSCFTNVLKTTAVKVNTSEFKPYSHAITGCWYIVSTLRWKTSESSSFISDQSQDDKNPNICSCCSQKPDLGVHDPKFTWNDIVYTLFLSWKRPCSCWANNIITHPVWSGCTSPTARWGCKSHLFLTRCQNKLQLTTRCFNEPWDISQNRIFFTVLSEFCSPWQNCSFKLHLIGTEQQQHHCQAPRHPHHKHYILWIMDSRSLCSSA